MYRKTSFHFIDVTEAQRVLLVIFHVVVRIMVLSAFKVVVKTLVAHRSHQQGSGGTFCEKLTFSCYEELGSIYNLYSKAKRRNLLSS